MTLIVITTYGFFYIPTLDSKELSVFSAVQFFFFSITQICRKNFSKKSRFLILSINLDH